MLLGHLAQYYFEEVQQVGILGNLCNTSFFPSWNWKPILLLFGSVKAGQRWYVLDEIYWTSANIKWKNNAQLCDKTYHLQFLVGVHS